MSPHSGADLWTAVLNKQKFAIPIEPVTISIGRLNFGLENQLGPALQTSLYVAADPISTGLGDETARLTRCADGEFGE
jgi:hypothetical protein